eukprot:GHRR01016326.1.p1 GENE.GHRR01016326.1~~GHRR01016326.1.p1  ORF type:complete len:366 (+),score=140.04 GHRR01016326.1:153-1250(+)
MRRVLSVQPVALQLLACRSTTLSAGPVAAFTICSSLTLQPGYSVQTVDLAGNQINMALPPLVVMSPTKKLPHSPVKQLGVPASLKAAVHPAMHAKSSIAALQPAQHCSRASLCASTVTPDRSLSAAHQQLPSSLFNSLGLHQQHQSQLQQQQQQPHHRVPQGLGFSRGHEASLHGSHPAGCRSVSCGSIATAERSAVGTGSNIQQHLQHFDILDYHRDLQPVAEAANLDAASDKPRSAMTGQRVPKQYDTPLGTDWLKCVPEHTPQIGDGRLELIVGPMFAGKSTHLLKRVQEVSHSRNRVAVAVKSSTDQRYGSNWVVTHDGKCMRCYAAETLTEFKHQLGPDYNKIQVCNSSFMGSHCLHSNL